MLSFTLLAAALVISSTSAAIKEGDPCGVESKNFLEYDFRGEFVVAGGGCSLGEDQEGCFCAPDFSDKQSLSGWKWQCNGTAKFGPVEGKMCPEEVPVPKFGGLGDPAVVESLQGVSVPCNTDIHPTGHPGNEVCGYSECETGGEYSAVCGCVDLDARGIQGGGVQWFCLHSTCDCGDDELKANGPSSAGSTAMTAGAAAFAALLL